MFCTNCGSKMNDDNKFCPNCGFQNTKSMPLIENNGTDNNFINEGNTTPKTPVGLIAVSWILFALCIVDDFLNFGVAIIISIAAIICSILLIINKNKAAKTNGIVIISIWALAFIITVLTNNTY